MSWWEELEYLESSTETDDKNIEPSILDGGNKMNGEISEDDLILKIEENFNGYEACLELFSIGEDVSESISFLNNQFDECLGLLAKSGVSLEIINQYRQRRNEQIKLFSKSGTNVNIR